MRKLFILILFVPFVLFSQTKEVTYGVTKITDALIQSIPAKAKIFIDDSNKFIKITHRLDASQTVKTAYDNSWVAEVNTSLMSSYATNVALELKAAKSDTGANKKNAAYYTTMAAIGLKANTASPTFTGVVTAPIVALSSTDTATGSNPVGSMFLRINATDTVAWILIRRTGMIDARWKKLTP
jgi:hypothetical protein